MKILVTGATGFIGRVLVDDLLREGHVVRAMVRDPDKAYLLCAQGVELVQGDIRDAPAVDRACQGVEAVFHLAAIMRQTKTESFQDVNVRGTANLTAAARTNGLSRLVYLTMLARPQGELLRSKAEAEQIVASGGVPCTIFRSTPVLGAQGGVFAHLAAYMARQLVAPVPGSGQIAFQPICVKNLTRMLINCLAREDFAGRCFDVAGPSVYTLDELAGLAARFTGKRLAMIHLPRFVVRANTFLMRRAREQRVFGKVDLLLLEQALACDPSAAAAELGVELSSVEEAIRADPRQHLKTAAHKARATA
jgi:NADH dehydrogenase